MEPRERGGVDELSAGTALPVGGQWQVDLEEILWTMERPEDNYFDMDDAVCLRIRSGSQIVGATPSLFSLGPFPLGDFHPASIKIAAFEDPYLEIQLVTASPSDATGEPVVLATGILKLPYDQGVHNTVAHRLALRLNHRSSEDAGLAIRCSATLLSTKVDFGPEIEQLLAHMKSPERKYAVIFSDPPCSSFRLTLSERACGEWWALSVDNKGREKAGVPYCGGVKYSMTSGVPGTTEFNAKPLPVFLKAHGLSVLLPRVENWQTVYPHLKLRIIEHHTQSRRCSSNVKVLCTRLELDGKEILPWYNFASWGWSYPVSNNSQRTEWSTSEPIEDLRQRFEALINEETGLWVDVAHRLMVVYGDEVVVDGIGIRSMHVTIPIPEDHIHYFQDIPPPSPLIFSSC